MIGFLVRRLGQALAVMLFVAFLSFLLFNFVGDPVDNMVGQEASLSDREAIREQLGLNDPVPLRFARFVVAIGNGDFGVSYRFQRPIAALIAERLPATAELVLVSTCIAVLVGLPLGIYTGIHRDAWSSRLILTLSLVGASLPTFVIGILLIYIFSVTLGWLPSFGRGEVVQLDFWSTGLFTVSGWKALVLPSVTLSLFQVTIILRLVRSAMLEIMQTDYIKFARARGLPESTISYGHALKNTAVPVITIIGLNIGTLIAFSIVTETVFQWPGMGFLFIQAVGFADIPIMAAYLLLVAFVFVTLNLIVDILCRLIDPRLGDVRSLSVGVHG